MRRIAIIGAGAAGLVAAREMIRAGHEVRVFERSGEVGGIWRYTDKTDDDLSSRNPEETVWSSVYASLRTNLPRDVMAYLDYTFDSSGGGEDEWPRFPHHSLVLHYLQNFAMDFGIRQWVEFNTTVTDVVPEGQGWRVVVAASDSTRTEAFDAVLVCNGHYSKPRLPSLEGLEDFTGEVWHSHNYRRPGIFRGRRIALWGTSASGADIATELSAVADVIWCGNAFEKTTPGSKVRDLHVFPSPRRITPEGRLAFADGSVSEPVDTFMFCTGYEYDFPFLAPDIVRVSDNRVHPLYQQLISPDYPTLGFIGIPFLIIPFPLFEIQSKWFAALLGGAVQLPAASDMHRQIDDEHEQRSRDGVLERHAHKLGDEQTAYYNLLAAQCGEPPLPDWFGEVASSAQRARFESPENFREAVFPAPGPTAVP